MQKHIAEREMGVKRAHVVTGRASNSRQASLEHIFAYKIERRPHLPHHFSSLTGHKNELCLRNYMIGFRPKAV
jgi:hypothetical protein